MLWEVCCGIASFAFSGSLFFFNKPVDDWPVLKLSFQVPGFWNLGGGSLYLSVWAFFYKKCQRLYKNSNQFHFRKRNKLSYK